MIEMGGDLPSMLGTVSVMKNTRGKALIKVVCG